MTRSKKSIKQSIASIEQRILEHHKKIADAKTTGTYIDSIPHWQHEIDELERNLEKYKRMLYG